MREQLADPAELPAVDLEDSANLLGGERIAKEMLGLLRDKLPLDLKKIDAAYKAHDYQDLANMAHRLVGGTAYCGVPALRTAARALEYAANDGIKKHIEDCYNTLQQQVIRFNAESNSLLGGSCC